MRRQQIICTGKTMDDFLKVFYFLVMRMYFIKFILRYLIVTAFVIENKFILKENLDDITSGKYKLIYTGV